MPRRRPCCLPAACLALLCLPSTGAEAGSVTYTLDATVAASATGSVTNAVSVGLPVGSTDPTPGNNSADDTNTIVGEADLVEGREPVAVRVFARVRRRASAGERTGGGACDRDPATAAEN